MQAAEAEIQKMELVALVDLVAAVTGNQVIQQMAITELQTLAAAAEERVILLQVAPAALAS
jgi:hypothetical protein